MCSAFLNCAIFFDSVKFGGQDTHLKVAEQQIKEKPLRNTPAYELFFDCDTELKTILEHLPVIVSVRNVIAFQLIVIYLTY